LVLGTDPNGSNFAFCHRLQKELPEKAEVLKTESLKSEDVVSVADPSGGLST
jgi:hypothetical protein